MAVRPRDNGTEVDIHVTVDSTWRLLGDRRTRVDASAAFVGAIGPDPIGGRVTQVEIV